MQQEINYASYERKKTSERGRKDPIIKACGLYPGYPLNNSSAPSPTRPTLYPREEA